MNKHDKYTDTAPASSREKILGNIRAGRPANVAHPAVKMFKVPGDPIDNFRERLESFSGDSKVFGSRTEAVKWLENELSSTDSIVFSSIPDFKGTVRAEDFPDPHDANTVKYAVCQGIVGVGETGSIFVSDESLGLPAAALFCEHLYIFVPRRLILSSLQEAYSLIPLRSHQYGSFYTGPSATADIEAVHITGAQAELALTAIIYDSEE